MYKIHTLPKYQPRWMYWVAAVASILTGLADLVVLPFGYRCGLSVQWAQYMMRYNFERRKEEYG